MPNDYFKCRYCNKWFIKGDNTKTRKVGKRYIHETTCPCCGNIPRVEHSWHPSPTPTNFKPQREVEIYE